MTEKLTHYLEAWGLADPQLLATTATSQVYTVLSAETGTRVVLKVLTPLGMREEHQGAVALHYWDGRGAVYLLREDKGAHLLEYADGEDLIPMVEQGDDEQATAIIADVLNQLHSASSTFSTEGLVPLETHFQSLFKKAALDRQSGDDSVYMRAARIAEAVFADPREVRVLHGDMHHENIRYREGRGWLAFDPKGVLGERTYDAANTLCNPVQMPERVENEARLLKNAEILAQLMGIERSRILQFVFMYACLSASWYVEDGVYPRQNLRVAEIVEPHLSLASR